MKRTSQVIAFLFLCLPIQVSSVAYPSTYPFDSTLSESVPQSIPTYTFDANDPGGYILQALNCDFNDEQFVEPFATGTFYPRYLCNTFRYFLVTLYKLADTYAPGTANCSLLPALTLDIPKSIGYPDGTCEDLGVLGIRSLNFEPFDFWIGGLEEIGNCEPASEVTLCVQVLASVNWCIDHFLSPSERSYITPCSDAMLEWVSSCTFVFPMPNFGLEPESYWASLSPEETEFLSSIIFNEDRVCKPYSYYYTDDTSVTVMWKYTVAFAAAMSFFS